MKSHSGNIALLGNAVIDRSYYKYSVIEFSDGTLLQDVKVPKNLDNFLERALSQGVSPTLYVAYGNFLIGVDIGDGRRYCSTVSVVLLAITFMLALALLPIFGLGLLLVNTLISSFDIYVSGNDLASKGFNRLPWKAG